MKVVVNSLTLKQINIELVKTALKIRKHGTKNSIARDTGLSVATCGNILDELCKSGEVIETALAPSTGGRPSRRFVYNAEYAYIAVISIRIERGAHSIQAAVVNLAGETVHDETIDNCVVDYDLIEKITASMIDKFSKIKVISIGIPGIVDSGNIGLCDVPRLENINLLKKIYERFDRNAVIENDVNCVAAGYYQKLDNYDPEGLVYLYYPQDGLPGAGIIINGKIIRGSTNFAGEVSFLPLCEGRNSEDYIVETILTLDCVLNPDTVIISGRGISPKKRVEIKSAISERAPADHIPFIEFDDDIQDSYISGLISLGLAELSCEYDVVERRRI